MNNIPCGVIRDLLPLYTEELCSEESRALVENHLKDCSGCRSLKESMKKTEPLPVDSGESLKKVKKELRNRRGRVAAMAALLVFVLLVTAFSWYSKPEYYPYSENLISVREFGDKIEISFTGVARASLETREDPEGGTMAILYAWTSPMDRRSKIDTMTIPKVDALYYCWEVKGENTVLLAGETDAAAWLCCPAGAGLLCASGSWAGHGLRVAVAPVPEGKCGGRVPADLFCPGILSHRPFADYGL